MGSYKVGIAEQNTVLQLFEQIAEEEGWQPGDQLRAHLNRSGFFGCWEKDLLIGGLQLVTPDEAGEVPTHLVWPELPILGSDSVHAAVLAVLPWRSWAGH
ncbi:hypothetical protein [Armatimonas rosea]|uniref:Uncharacterized protein n=1 Tax=Armatimonas rosea TaxID=685828 RepID=A0A7W9SQ09_ARMRO|nr:hypothetical protein [Armatimonas rosea]MBB6050727.1 hypothetical protein [Armatimonas rosea]